MASDAVEPIAIRSFRVCFQLERRVHKIDKWRIPVPYGVPVRGIGYGALLLVLVLLLGRIAVVGDLLGVLHPSLRYIMVPIGGAYVLMRWKVDGRAAHATGLSWVRMHLEPRRVAGCRAATPLGPVTFGEVTVAPDEHSARLRPAVVEGAGRLVLRYPVRLSARGSTLRVAADGDEAQWRGKQVNLQPGQRVVLG
jgi:hypothetical protein